MAPLMLFDTKIMALMVNNDGPPCNPFSKQGFCLILNHHGTPIILIISVYILDWFGTYHCRVAQHLRDSSQKRRDVAYDI